MKEKYLPCKYLLLIIILFTCLFIFSTPSFALIPGDFNGDGQVGFPDLIIFALAYNTTPSDPKWNPVCDLDSNNIIGFGDLIIFAMHYGEEENINPFVGYWINEDTNTGGITKINIQENNNLLEIHMWGKCDPTDCDWGIETTDISDAADGILNIVWYPDFAIKTQELILLSDGRLKVITFVDFYPDDIYGREDFEFTEYFEFLQSGEGVVTGVEIVAITRELQTTGVEPEAMSLFEEESNTSKDYQIVNINNGLKGETENGIIVLFDTYYEVEGYKVYKRINDGEFNMVYDLQNPSTASVYGVFDSDISEGNIYSYYVTAYGPDWETAPSEIVTITITSETFLPPCSLTSPTDGSNITDPNPVFSWSPVGLGTSNLPYGQVYSGETYLRIYDADTYETAWSVWFDDMTTSTATYDQNGSADPLIPGHNYRWYVDTYGYDNNGNTVAFSESENWNFTYE